MHSSTLVSTAVAICLLGGCSSSDGTAPPSTSSSTTTSSATSTTSSTVDDGVDDGHRSCDLGPGPGGGAQHVGGSVASAQDQRDARRAQGVVGVGDRRRPQRAQGRPCRGIPHREAQLLARRLRCRGDPVRVGQGRSGRSQGAGRGSVAAHADLGPEICCHRSVQARRSAVGEGRADPGRDRCSREGGHGAGGSRDDVAQLARRHGVGRRLQGAGHGRGRGRDLGQGLLRPGLEGLVVASWVVFTRAPAPDDAELLHAA